MMIIVRYAEIGTKSRRTRRRIEGRLVNNIKLAIGHGRVKRVYGRIFVDSDSLDEAEKIAKVFGVASTSLAIKTSSELENIIEKGVDHARKRIKENMSFAVRARRTGKQEYSSKDIAVKLGAEIREATKAEVDLDNPDETIFVEVREGNAYVFDSVIQGVGGLPLGTQGRAIALISGGIDSPVAVWMMMKRGVDIVALFMDTRPLVDDRTSKRAFKTIKKLAEWKNGPLKTYTAPFGNVLLRLLKVEDYKLGCILCKRMMYRVAEVIAKKEGVKAIITGESLGQVASQTLDNLYVIDKVIQLPVFRPLLGMDKDEIIKIARKIGTYDISILPANCCLGPPLHPETKASLSRVEKAETSLDIEKFLEEMVKDAKVKVF